MCLKFPEEYDSCKHLRVHDHVQQLNSVEPQAPFNDMFDNGVSVLCVHWLLYKWYINIISRF